MIPMTTTVMTPETEVVALYHDSYTKANPNPWNLAPHQFEAIYSETVFYLVGHNASHYFYLGVDAHGQLVKVSLDPHDELGYADAPEHPVTDLRGEYLGHH